MRYKEYNVNMVLEKAIDEFWVKGFRGCSVNDLVEKTGVNRFSLYHEFDNKEGILYASMRLYKERYSNLHHDILLQEGTAKEIIKNFLLRSLTAHKVHQGCYFIQIGTELADSDERIKELVDNYLKELEELFQAMLLKRGHTLEGASLAARHLVGLYCTTMSFCLIHTEEQRIKHINNGLEIILEKSSSYAKSIK